MKKILSLVLAVAMLSSMAFASGPDFGLTSVDVKPGTDLQITAGSFFDDNDNVLNVRSGDFTSDNFRIVKQSFSKGANLVKEVKIDNDDECVVISLKEDYSLVMPNSDNLVVKELSVQAKKRIEYNGETTVNRTTVYKMTGNMSTRVGYSQGTTDIDGNISYPIDNMTKFVKVGTNGDVVGIASASGADYYIEGRVYDGDKVYFNATNKPNKDVIKLYEDADLRFVNITTNGLPSNNDIQITAEKDEFVYKVVDGKIAASGLKWSDDDYAWVGKIRTTTSYVISDIELKVSASTSTGSENPDTGANDVVGVAAALAVVSLVAAGAVSLKK